MLLEESKKHGLKMEKGSWGDAWSACPDGNVQEGSGGRQGASFPLGST